MTKHKSRGSAENNVLREHAEKQFSDELKWLKESDNASRPPQWSLSPKAVRTFILGGSLDDDHEISTKYFGSQRLIEMVIATLATDRALLLMGVPGTAKTWLSELLSAAISGHSRYLVQGTSGVHEEALTYGWDYAQLIAKGPSEVALIPSPVMRAMQDGAIARVEEMTRMPSDVQDALITILSEKSLPIPELNREVQARQGFNLIATANDRDTGVHELSSALRRRFNIIQMPLPADREQEVEIVRHRLSEHPSGFEFEVDDHTVEEIERLVTVFRELRSGQTEDGQTRLRTPSSTLSTAEAISVMRGGLSLALHFGEGEIRAEDLAAGIRSAVIRDASNDSGIWEEYLESVLSKREGWEDLYEAFKALQ